MSLVFLLEVSALRPSSLRVGGRFLAQTHNSLCGVGPRLVATALIQQIHHREHNDMVSS